MSEDRLFLDTVFVQALLNTRDQCHTQAHALLPRIRVAGEVRVTDAVLLDVGNALCAINRVDAAAFIRRCYDTVNIHVVHLDPALLDRSLAMYESRADKTWSLTDCMSFVVMGDHGVTDAATATSTSAWLASVPSSWIRRNL